MKMFTPIWSRLYIIFDSVLWDFAQDSDIKGRTEIKGVWRIGFEVDIFTEEGISHRRIQKIV